MHFTSYENLTKFKTRKTENDHTRKGNGQGLLMKNKIFYTTKPKKGHLQRRERAGRKNRNDEVDLKE